jgi:hypothetical protein
MKPKLEARHPDTKAAGRDGVWSRGNCDLFRMPLRSLCGKAHCCEAASCWNQEHVIWLLAILTLNQDA